MGMFHRFKFALLGSATVESTALPQGAVLRVKLGFEDASSLELASDPIMLPTAPLAMEDDQGPMMAVSTSLPATKWIKIGSVEERAVAQLSLKRMKKVQVPATADRNEEEGIPCYRMSDMFIATPVARTALAGATATKATKATNSSASAREPTARDTKGGAAEEKAASTLTASETKAEEKPRKILIEDVTEVDGLD